MAKEKQETKPKGLADQLGALIYFEGIAPAKRKDAIPFEKMTEAEQAPFVIQAVRFLAALDKLNLVAQPKPDKEKAALTEQQNKDILIGIIKKFVAGLSTTKPALFPYEELALRILHPEKPSA